MITRIRLDEEAIKDTGLASFDFRDLGPVVILAGPNGGGKSRFLRALYNTVTAALKAPECIPGLQEQVNTHRRTGAMPELYAAEEALRASEAAANAVSWTVSPRKLTYLDTADANIRLPPGMRDPRQPHSREYLFTIYVQQRAKQLEDAARSLFNSEHPRIVHDSEVQGAGQRAQNFSRLLETTLGTPLTFRMKGVDPQPELFGRPYADGELSAGQHLLLVWTMLLDNGGLFPGDAVFVDEPERHLHPSAALDLLARIRVAVGSTGQLFVATHSPTIVAHFGRESVYYVEGGSVRYAGSRVDEVMNGLLGGPDGRRALLDFLGEAEELNFHRFAVEALFSPGVAGHVSGDPQELQCAQLVAGILATTEGKIRVLDYAAGKARFAVALADVLRPEMLARVDYFAFNDPRCDEYHDECVRNVRRVCGEESSDRVISDVTELFGAKRVHLVIMSNFLHEVDPRHWRDEFINAGNVLLDGGFLVIMEDQEPSVGELPTRVGAVVLDIAGARTLFGRTPEVQRVGDSERLAAFAVPRRLLDDETKIDLLGAIQETNRRAIRELRRIRDIQGEGTPQKRGRHHAFYALLAANTQILIEEMKP